MAVFSPEHIKIGQHNIMSCGIGATIIKYNSARNISVQFDDNIIVNNVSYSAFKVGQVAHPVVKTRDIKNAQIAKERIGMTNIMKCGLEAVIIDYHGNKKVKVQFMDGFTTTTSYSNFCKGSVGHSVLSGEKQKEHSENLNDRRVHSPPLGA